MAVRIESAQFPADTKAIHSLFSGYAASLGIDLTFQSFQEELDSLPGKYSEAQGGALLIARASARSGEKPDLPPAAQVALGCVALRRSSDDWCEMKRLYVLPEARGLHLGDQLVAAVLEKAKSLGYRGIRLDTLSTMTTARRLYARHGFSEIEPYYETPLENTIFLGCEFGQP
ncbi:hypothetical protein N7468_006181 [Penicillium chermesinum]|uniref:N-acetyltransferase domain-containing protein n=1 Tax=Penicillium chermesinum TaxID=63820 RepID=A0A9W9NRR2_9EURO|nr:uncharacterized protein N7468_006181 [Penicillium chermesinum]KAJ5224956.1 hypothetical protein N7468_006181 [Penicillium chermesinum]